MTEEQVQRPLAAWFTCGMIILAGLYAMALPVQLFLWDVLPVPPSSPDPFESIPTFIYFIEAFLLVVTASVAVARIRNTRHAVLISLVGAILLLPALPWNLASVVWLIRDYRRERDGARTRAAASV